MKSEQSALGRFMHYHAVDDSVYFYSVAILKRLLRQRLLAGESTFTFCMSNEEWETIWCFLDQLETLYEHPRSVSKRFRAFWKQQEENAARVMSTEIERESEAEKRRKKKRSANP